MRSRVPIGHELQRKWLVAAGWLRNLYPAGQLAYVVEPANWAIRSVGQAITGQLKQQRLLLGYVTASSWGLGDRLVHIGSAPSMQAGMGASVWTVFHVGPRFKRYPAKLLHTACTLTRAELVRVGIAEEKIRVIPLGVDEKIFRVHAPVQRAALRQRLGIPNSRFVIGSFQKDGVGWGDGNLPKMEKGPDTLVRVLSDIARTRPIHVLLIGPARGYVRTELKKLNIPFTSIGYLNNLSQVASYYAALDVYLIPARQEGGPLALLEAWASGVPVVSTKVGMVPDLASDGHEALLAEVEGVDELVKALKQLIDSELLRKKLIAQAQARVRLLHWAIIARRYYQELYQPILRGEI